MSFISPSPPGDKETPAPSTAASSTVPDATLPSVADSEGQVPATSIIPKAEQLTVKVGPVDTVPQPQKSTDDPDSVTTHVKYIDRKAKEALAAAARPVPHIKVPRHYGEESFGGDNDKTRIDTLTHWEVDVSEVEIIDGDEVQGAPDGDSVVPQGAGAVTQPVKPG